MTINERICNAGILNGEERLRKLAELKAPGIITAGQEAEIEMFKQGLKDGSFPINGDAELLKVEWRNSEVKKGNRGKVYISFNDGEVLYFPNARYGKYIKGAE